MAICHKRMFMGLKAKLLFRYIFVGALSLFPLILVTENLSVTGDRIQEIPVNISSL